MFYSVFFFKQKTAYELRISDWSSDVCSSDLVWRNWLAHAAQQGADIRGIDATRGAGFSDSAMAIQAAIAGQGVVLGRRVLVADDLAAGLLVRPFGPELQNRFSYYLVCPPAVAQSRDFIAFRDWLVEERSEEHTSELQSLMRISYAAFCLKQTK